MNYDYFKYYKGEDKCPDDWSGESNGIIWGAEKAVAESWDHHEKMLRTGEAKGPAELYVASLVLGIAASHAPYSMKEVEEDYFKGREDLLERCLAYLKD